MNKNLSTWDEKRWLGGARLGVADWKDEPSAVVKAINKQLSWHDSQMRLRYRDTTYGWTISLVSKVNGTLASVSDDLLYAKDVLENIEMLLKVSGLRIAYDGASNGETIIWTLRRDRRIR